MSFYSNMAATALRLVTKYGQSITLTRPTGGTFSPTTGAETGGTTTTITGYGAAVPWEKTATDQNVNNDLMVILEATSTAPAINDTCTINSVAYKVVSIDIISPAGTVVAYVLRCRL
jgi:hypothetical protein